MRRSSNFETTFHLNSMLKTTISRVSVSAFVLVLLCTAAKADPVVPVGTVLSGTITASSNPLHAIAGSFQTLDQNGNPFVLTFDSQGGPLDSMGAPGPLVTFQAGIAGDSDQGNSAFVQLIFMGTGPAIPNVATPTLDLIGTGTITFQGSACAQNCLIDPPLFTVSGVFSGPVALHFVSIDVNGQTRYQLQTATFTGTPVPEPVSMLLFASGLAGSSVAIRRKRRLERY